MTYHTCHFIDPRRISERLFGGPHFAEFFVLGPDRIICKRTGDVFDTRCLSDAWMEGRNLAPIIYGKGPVVLT